MLFSAACRWRQRPLAHVVLETLAAASILQDLVKWHVCDWERVINVIFPACSKAAGRKIETSFAIIGAGTQCRKWARQLTAVRRRAEPDCGVLSVRWHCTGSYWGRCLRYVIRTSVLLPALG